MKMERSRARRKRGQWIKSLAPASRIDTGRICRETEYRQADGDRPKNKESEKAWTEGAGFGRWFDMHGCNQSNGSDCSVGFTILRGLPAPEFLIFRAWFP